MTAPSDTCVLSGQPAEFPCQTLSSTDLPAGQEWNITTLGSESIIFRAASFDIREMLPPAYEWILMNPTTGVEVVAGLRVVSSESSFNGATFQCIAFRQQERNTSAPAATLEIAGKVHILLYIQDI